MFGCRLTPLRMTELREAERKSITAKEAKKNLTTERQRHRVDRGIGVKIPTLRKERVGWGTHDSRVTRKSF